MIEKATAILWDFDGVILNSNAIRDSGFELVLAEFPKDQVDKLLQFHRANSGLSRYVKFRYFFETVRNENITDQEVQKWADKFSEIMRSSLANNQLLIKETVAFIERFHRKVPMHIVSGSDQNELRFLCKALKIEDYFISIHGSPTPKTRLVQELMKTHKYAPDTTFLIGDSRNDFEAARDNKLCFLGYNNKKLQAEHGSFNPLKIKTT